MRAVLITLVLTLSLTSAQTPSDDEWTRVMRDADAAIARGALDAAIVLARQAAKVSSEDPARAIRAHMLAGDLELKRKRPVNAARRYRDAAHLTIADPVARRRATSKRRAALATAKSAKRLAHATKLVEADALVREAEQSPRRPARGRALRAKLADAAALYRRDRDLVFADRALAARALVAARSGAIDEALAEASPLTARSQPPSIRRVALEALVAAAGRDLDALTAATLDLNAAEAETLPEARRRHHRRRGLDALCGRYDRAHAPGACARLEHERTGSWTFTDRSRERPRRELSDADVAVVHAQLLPALEACLRVAAKADPEQFRGTDVRIGWTIQPMGLVSDEEIAPKRYRGALEPCVRERLSWARYPRYTSGERKSVTIPYHLD